MKTQLFSITLLVASLCAGQVLTASAAETDSPVLAGSNPFPPQAQATIDRALTFMVEDSARWRSARRCATCHHGAMTVWTLSEAKSRGFAVSTEVLDDTIQWTKDLFVPQFSKPRDLRPGYNFVSVPAMYLGVMSQSLPILSREELTRVGVHLARHQEADGAWMLPPATGNGAPPTWESPETLALWALLAWETTVPADPELAATTRAAREKALTWLASITPTETTQALVLRLQFAIRSGNSAEHIASQLEQLLSLQNADGGWSQLKDLPSDAYATGQVLWALSCAGVPVDHPAIGRAISFLIATQRDDGSWSMQQRWHPQDTEKKARLPVPITYFGSAWGTLGLVRYVPVTLDAATMHRRAITLIRGLSGVYETDPNNNDALLSISFNVELDDEQLAKLAKLLTASPALRSLRLKATYLTDAGAANLQALTQLQTLSLEDGAFSDTGLASLKTLTGLKELILKGTKVTDAGVSSFQQAVPGVKIER